MRVGRVSEVEVAELGDHHAVRREVFERGLDHLLRVQVALRQHERPGGGRVGGGVTVRRDEPDQVVGVVAAGEKRTTVALAIVDLRVRRDVAGVVGELSPQHRHGDGVQLDGVDMSHAVGQCGLHLVATGGADDQDIWLIGRGRGERDLPTVGEEAVGGRRRAVVAPDRRAPQPVVMQEVEVAELDGVDAEHRAPVPGGDGVGVADRLRRAARIFSCPAPNAPTATRTTAAPATA